MDQSESHRATTDAGPVGVTGIHSVTVAVDDHDRALTFYRDVLGYHPVFDGEALPGARLVVLEVPGADVPVLLIARGGDLPVGVRYLVADAETAHAALTAAGAVPHTEVLRLPGSPPMFTCSDPEGNTVIVMEQQPSG